MADIQVNNAPFIKKWFYVTGAFGEERTGGRIHKGLDLAPTGYSGKLYAIDDFTVIYSGVDGGGYGNYFIARSDSLGYMYLYAHMSSLPPSVNSHYTKWQYVGEAGMTGSATGVHLHLEMQRGTTWNYNADISGYVNPCEYLTDINNIATYSTRYYFNGNPTPPGPTPPTPTDKTKHKFPWFIYFRKRRENL